MKEILLFFFVFLTSLSFLIVLEVSFKFSQPKERDLLWHYQLQEYNCKLTSRWSFDYVVVDLDEFNCNIRMIPGKVLAYISIGEAEDYREYWKSIPRDLILFENPEWRGNYAVKFWDPRWKKVVFERVEEAKKRGFDGVYLDKADVYEDVSHKGEMVKFLCEISKRAREMNLLVFVQNAVELYPLVKDCLDGVGKEDTWYFDDEELNGEGLEYLRRAKLDGKTVLVVDYPAEKGKVCSFYERCFNEGFYCTVSNRELNLPFPVTCPSS